MKKFLRIFMSAVLAITMVPAVAFADTGSAKASGATGELVLSMHRKEALADTNFTVTLKSGASTKSATFKAAKDAELAEGFLSDIANGKYELSISAPKYLPYKQTLDFDGRCIHLDLYNYQSANDGVASNAKLGVMPAGDMNGDGQINDTDADLVKNAIEKNNAAYDISGNGTVDLDDVAFVVRNAGGAVAATPVHTISSAVLKQSTTVSQGTGTAIQGTASNLLTQSTDGGSVSLKRTDNSKISASKPVEVNIAANASGQSLQSTSQAIVIAPPAGSDGTANTMSEGSVVVEGVNENGQTVTINAPVNAAASKSSAAAQSATPLAAYEGVEADQAATEGDQADPEGTTDEGAPAADQGATDQGANEGSDSASDPGAQDAVAQPAPAAPGISGVSAAEPEKRFANADEVTVENDGTVVINLGTRVAIKKVTIRVTATANQGNLAEIAKVEFLSDFAERIPEPQLSIPTVTKVTNTDADGQGYKNITIQWTPQTNVTGYEVSVSGPGYNKTALATKASHTFQGDSFNGTVKAFQNYTIKVRSVSGDWRSQWSDPFTHFCTETKAPPAPQYVKLTPLVERLSVSWNCKFNAEWFSLYYREKGASGDYAKVEKITGSSYGLPGLKAGKYYQVYVVAHNRNGASPKSLIAEARTLESNLTRMPKFDLLNVNDANGMATTGIKSITGNRDKTYDLITKNGTVNNSKATYEDWKAILDNDPNTYLYIPDWDSGVSYANFRGPIIQLAQRTDVDTFRWSPSDKVTDPGYSAVRITYKDYDRNAALTNVNASISTKYDPDNHKYYEVVASRPMNSDYFEIRLTTNGNSRHMSMQELKIYKYNSLDNDIANLFSDSMRTMVKSGVTVAQVQALIDRSNAIDPATGEMHPHHASQIAELNYAMDIVKNGAHEADFVHVDNQVTSKGEPSSGFAQALSDNQPLGYVAGTSDTVVIYVTDDSGKTSRGSRANLNLICTQMHPEVTAWQKSVALNAGRNEVTIPRVSSLGQERGGALYLQYTGNKGQNDYKVRVVGASKIPVLRAAGLTGTDRRKAIEKYVDELKAYAQTVQGSHNKLHKGSENAHVDYTYDQKNCILNFTDITMDNMMYSFPATQVNSALGASATTAARADKLEKALAGMETQIDYFYQFKGLNKAGNSENGFANNRYPKLYLNIRYHRMFTGAFMYAAGKHIGIEWGSVGGDFGLTPVQADAKGARTAGSMSGWGIAHEIGHCINAAAYQRVEVTNNVYAQLAKAATSGETSAAFRANYEKVYNGVVAGNVCHNGDLKVQLAQYWQLHLAYDNNYAFKKFSSIDEQQRGLFYARMETYMRDRSRLTAANLPAFIGNPSGDQLFMQAACAAAKKNVLGFFTAWGYKPNADTIKYAANFPEETRKIQYIDDDARLHRLQGKSQMTDGTKVTASITNATNKRINGNKVIISLANNNKEDGAMLGYEIKRNGKVVGFVYASKTSFTDVIATENNKAFTYEVTAYDKYLRPTETVDLGEVKVCHDGSISKANWTATSTTATSKQDTLVEGSADDPDAGSVEGTTVPGTNKISGAKNLIDNNVNTIFCAEGASTSAATRPNVVIDLGGMEQVTALKYTPAKKSTSTANTYSDNFTDDKMNSLRPYGYKIELSQDGNTWTTVKEGSLYQNGFKMDDSSTWKPQSDLIVNNDSNVPEDKSFTIYFSKRDKYGNLEPYMNTYDAAFVRLTATNMSTFAAGEIDILGPTSDNVELVAAGYGNLSSDYKYDPNEPPIPAGSRVMYGEYKGDPAYNIVLLKDKATGKVIDGQFIILADVAEKGMLGETSDGRWIFWMENKTKTDSNGDTYNELLDFKNNNVKKVQAELYRVQDAMTLAGQRLTSTSLTVSLPANPGNVNLTSVKAATPALNAAAPSAMYSMHDDKAVDNNGNVVFDDAATVDTADLESAAAENNAADNTVQAATSGVDGKYANIPDDATPTASPSLATLNSIEAVENASAGQVVGLFAANENDTIDVDQASLKAVDNGFAFKVNPSSIAIASEGVFTFDPALPANAKIDVKGLSNAKSANATYNGSFRDAQGKIHVFAIARSGILGNCATSQTNMSITGSISGLDHRVKGVANYIRDISGDYAEPTVTNVGANAVDFFAYKPSISVTASPATYTYTKKVITPKLVVKAGAVVLKEGTDYTVSYAGARKTIGAYTVTVTGKGAYAGATATTSFQILPKGTTLKKVTGKKKSMVVSIKKQATETTGYKIRYSLKKNMSGAKTATVNKAKTTTATIKKLKSKKTYYVQVATFKKIGKVVYQSDWSKAKTVKVK